MKVNGAVDVDDEKSSDSYGDLVRDVVRNNGSNNNNRNNGGGDRTAALSYLLKYESMIRQQEAEEMATLAHLKPCVDRLLELVGTAAGTTRSAATSTTNSDRWLQEAVCADELETALRRLDGSSASKKNGTEFMQTDRQLMTVLRLLTCKVSNNDVDEEGDDDGATSHSASTASSSSSASTTITWSEFVQCYKVCVDGMMTLQHLPNPSPERSRARDRTLEMMRLFHPASSSTPTATASAASRRTGASNGKTVKGSTKGKIRANVFAAAAALTVAAVAAYLCLFDAPLGVNTGVTSAPQLSFSPHLPSAMTKVLPVSLSTKGTVKKEIRSKSPSVVGSTTTTPGYASVMGSMLDRQRRMAAALNRAATSIRNNDGASLFQKKSVMFNAAVPSIISSSVLGGEITGGPDRVSSLSARQEVPVENDTLKATSSDLVGTWESRNPMGTEKALALVVASGIVSVSATLKPSATAAFAVVRLAGTIAAKCGALLLSTKHILLIGGIGSAAAVLVASALRPAFRLISSRRFNTRQHASKEARSK